MDFENKEIYMTLIIGMILTLAIIFGAKDFIKKYPVASYLISLIFSIAVIYLVYTETAKMLPEWFGRYFLGTFVRGVFATTIFMVVMFLGCVRKHTPLTRKLMEIRAELSIIGCIFALTHNVIFGKRYFVWLLMDRSQFQTTNQLVAAIISAILVVLMLILMITSFKCVRSKMSAITWKNVQKLAYPFFYLIYVHIMVLYAAKFNEKILDIAIYTIIYLTYTALRLKKANSKMSR